MKIQRITFAVILVALVVLVGLKFYAQYRHINIFVGKMAPMPEELASGLHMAEHKIKSTVRIESPYDTAEEKILSMDEIRKIRSDLVWHSGIPPFIDSLIIQNPTNVIARRISGRAMNEYQLVKANDRWVVAEGTRSAVQQFGDGKK